MSAWLCGNKTLSLCVDVIKQYKLGGYEEKSNKELMNILSDLNTKSLNYRYGENDDHILENREYVKLDVEDGQKHKSVSCYLYQTCEDPENIKHPLFEALDSYREVYFEKYVNGDYYWDIDIVELYP